jgi:cation transport regulator ChaC
MKYFAYGSNMDQKRMKKRGVRFSERVHAILKGYSLKFNKITSDNPKKGYANIVPDKNGIVEGVLYEIVDSDLSKLDSCEGYPQHYKRVNVKVQLDDGKGIEAVTYIAQPDKVKEGLKPSKGYLAHLLAAKDLLSEQYYKKLEACETID